MFQLTTTDQKYPCQESMIIDQTTISSDHHSTMTEAIGQVVGEAVAEVTVVEIIEVTMIDETQIDHQSHVLPVLFHLISKA